MALTQNRIVIFLSLCVRFLMNLNVIGFCQFVTLNSLRNKKNIIIKEDLK